MLFLGEERTVQHRRLQHRHLQPRQQCLDAVGQVARFEHEVEQHRDHLDGHRLDLGGARAERRFLQVAQDVVQALRYAGERNRRTVDVETGLSRLQARDAFVQRRRDHDGCAWHVAGRRGRHRPERPRSAGLSLATHRLGHSHRSRRLCNAAGVDDGQRCIRTRPRMCKGRLCCRGGLAPLRHAGRRSAAEHALEQRLHVHFGKRLRFGSCRGLATTAVLSARRRRRANRCRDHTQVPEMPVHVGVNRREVAERSLVERRKTWNLMALSALISFSASAKAATMICGARGLPLVSMSGFPRR